VKHIVAVVTLSNLQRLEQQQPEQQQQQPKQQQQESQRNFHNSFCQNRDETKRRKKFS
jgi:hypothetical protein